MGPTEAQCWHSHCVANLPTPNSVITTRFSPCLFFVLVWFWVFFFLTSVLRHMVDLLPVESYLFLHPISSVSLPLFSLLFSFSSFSPLLFNIIFSHLFPLPSLSGMLWEHLNVFSVLNVSIVLLLLRSPELHESHIAQLAPSLNQSLFVSILLC